MRDFATSMAIGLLLMVGEINPVPRDGFGKTNKRDEIRATLFTGDRRLCI
jgi:hypothetical protein